MTVSELPPTWRDRAAELRRYAPEVASAITDLAGELEKALLAEAEELLTLEQAAKISGYNADHLGALIREKKLRNHGRKHAPRIRRGDLPRKAATGAESPVDPSLTTVAGSIAEGRIRR